MRAEEGDEGLLRELRKLRQRVVQLERKLDQLARGAPPMEEETVRTFVEGFDEALGGGVPAGHVVIVRGPAGTMKTSLGLYVASRNRERGMRPLFISLEEDRESLLRTMKGLGMGEEDFIVDIATMRAEHGLVDEAGDWLQILMSYLSKKVEAGVDLLVIDPFNSLYEMAQIAFPRKDLFQFFRFLRGSRLTTFLVFEGEDLGYREDYMADGVLEITPRELEGGRVALWMRCVKMRHTDHSRDYYQLEFRRDRFLALPVAR
jgi:KaiC/GvpD/RAD55 family RecA-like ATPase